MALDDAVAGRHATLGSDGWSNDERARDTDEVDRLSARVLGG
jgi:hypothetical protein